MKLQRMVALTKKELKKTIRQPAGPVMIFLFPVVFCLCFCASFGGLGGGQPVYQIGVVSWTREHRLNPYYYSLMH